MVFLVFNSGRAVNEKINLVNAADAAAYSGAQIAARQLNFMAYTNRAMIANEVSIGHMFSYQLEIDLMDQLLQSFSANTGGPLFQIILFIVDLFIQGDFSSLVNQALGSLGEIIAVFGDVMEGVSGAYLITIDANNAFYSTLQQEAFRDFAYPTEGRPLVETAMQAVVRDYQLRESAEILLNDDAALQYLASSNRPELVQAGEQAASMNADMCRMIMFVGPSQIQSTQVGAGNAVEAFCNNLMSGGSGGNGVGTPDNPASDQGAMLEMLRATVSNFSNAEWIRDRNSDYSLVFGLFPAHRRGATTVDYDTASGQLNWNASNDTMRINYPLFGIPMFQASASDDAAAMSARVGNLFNDGVVQLFETYGLCGDDANVDCSSLANGQYRGVQRYTYLNPDFASTSPRVTAVLSQPKCGDNIGRNDDGSVAQGWHDNMRFLEQNRSTERKICDGTVYAVAQAEVFFQRPVCTDAQCQQGFSNSDGNRTFEEKPNLFNPFWQVRLVR